MSFHVSRPHHQMLTRYAGAVLLALVTLVASAFERSFAWGVLLLAVLPSVFLVPLLVRLIPMQPYTEEEKADLLRRTAEALARRPLVVAKPSEVATASAAPAKTRPAVKVDDDAKPKKRRALEVNFPLFNTNGSQMAEGTMIDMTGKSYGDIDL